MSPFLHRALVAISFALGAFATAAPASAAVYLSNFSQAGLGGDINNPNPEDDFPGYYYSTAHFAEQTFDTGLASVNYFKLILDPVDNDLTAPLGFTFWLNSVELGDASFAPGATTAKVIQFNFADILSLSGDYTLRMEVTTPVCSGCFSLSFSESNPLTLAELAPVDPNEVPEPASLALLGLGLLAAGFSRARKAR